MYIILRVVHRLLQDRERLADIGLIIRHTEYADNVIVNQWLL